MMPRKTYEELGRFMNTFFRHMSVLAILLICTGCGHYWAETVFQNKSSQKITRLVVSLGKGKQVVTDIQPGQSVTLKFDVRGDASYLIHAEFEDGKTLEGNTGYVTTGFNYKHECIIQKGRIRLVETSIEHNEKWTSSTPVSSPELPSNYQ